MEHMYIQQGKKYIQKGKKEKERLIWL